MLKRIKKLIWGVAVIVLMATTTLWSAPAHASDPFIAQIVMFGGNFAPRGWAFCDGQLLPISQNTALFSILGTTYGGDGRTTFGLPDLRGRFAMHEGNGPGLTPRPLGQKSGTETNTLSVAQLPSHTHTAMGTESRGNSEVPTNNTWASRSRDRDYSNVAPSVAMSAASIGHTGSGQAINNMPPYQVVNYIIALVGVFPSRS